MIGKIITVPKTVIRQDALQTVKIAKPTLVNGYRMVALRMRMRMRQGALGRTGKERQCTASFQGGNQAAHSGIVWDIEAQNDIIR